MDEVGEVVCWWKCWTGEYNFLETGRSNLWRGNTLKEGDLRVSDFERWIFAESNLLLIAVIRWSTFSEKALKDYSVAYFVLLCGGDLEWLGITVTRGGLIWVGNLMVVTDRFPFEGVDGFVFRPMSAQVEAIEKTQTPFFSLLVSGVTLGKHTVELFNGR